jgi:peptide/nickel transport system permease protein
MANFLIRRILAAIPVVMIVAVIVFMLLRLTPGDPAAAIVGDAGSTQDIQLVRAQLGLDLPLPRQFIIWVGRTLSGNLGESYYYKQSISSLISQRLQPTLSLGALTLITAVIIAVPLGAVAGWRQGRVLDRALMTFSVLGFSIPGFVISYTMIWLFSLHLGWLPSQGYSRLEDGLWPWLRHLLLPASTLSIVYIALIARVTRAAVSEALTEDYIRTARAKGVGEMRVLVQHALANAAVPIVTVIGLGLALLISGVVVTETVFAIPGLGQLTVDAVLSRDYPLIQGVTLLFSLSYVLVNLLVDVSYIFLDPRIRH